MKLLNLIFNPEGKIGRLQFLGGYIAVFILVSILYFIPVIIFMFLYSSSDIFYGVAVGPKGGIVLDMNYMHTNLLGDFWYAFLFLVPASIIFIYSKICLDIKRFRDTGFSPWFILLFLIPWVNILVFLFLLIFPAREQD